jgi:hypothetical protein
VWHGRRGRAAGTGGTGGASGTGGTGGAGERPARASGRRGRSSGRARASGHGVVDGERRGILGDGKIGQLAGVRELQAHGDLAVWAIGEGSL